MLKNKLHLKDAYIMRAHRIGQKVNGKPDIIVAKLSSYKTNEKVINKDKNLTGTGVFVNRDYSIRF